MTISSTLNIGSTALQTQMAAITVAGNNIANVDTPGYSRQVLNLSSAASSQSGIGFFGNGVNADSITRQYDQFMVQRLMSQNSSVSNLTTQQQSMQVIESTFNEVSGSGVNDQLSQFWASLQSLSNNPEDSATRQTVVQQAQLLSNQLNSMSAQLTQTKIDTDTNLKSSVAKVNSLTQQLADLNGKITSTETPTQQQNSLRDTRDSVLQQLAGYMNINYFEASNGADTVTMADGHTLVTNNQAWNLDWSNDSLQWVNTTSSGQSVSTPIDSNADLGGSIGGLLQVNNQLAEGNPNNYLGQLNALANSLIREVNQQASQGVGLESFSSQLTSAESANNATLLQTTVDTRAASSTIAAGTIKINGSSVGQIDGSAITYGLAMGKTANAAQAINAANAGVQAMMTTQVAGFAPTAMTAAENGSTLSFTINGIAVSYKVDSTSLPANDTDPAVLASHLTSAINSAITNYNTNSGLTPPQTNTPPLTVEAVAGNGDNGGAQNSIVLRNTNQGDESTITIGDLASVDNLGNTTTTIDKIGLTAGSYQADATHNTGELSVFSNKSPITIDGGATDTALAQLGWAGTTTYSNQAAIAEPAPGDASNISFSLNGQNITVAIPGTNPAQTPDKVAQLAVTQINQQAGTTGVRAVVGDGTNGGPPNSIVFTSQTSNIEVSDYAVNAGTDVLGFGDFTKIGVAAADQTPGDGKLTYSSTDNEVPNSLMGLDYADTLKTDGGSFNIWLYNKDGSLALAQPVPVDLTRAYTLDDVAKAINASIENATNSSTPCVNATVVANQLVLTPDANHNFAFSNDTSNFLAAMGVNTFFTGNSASTIGVNQTVSDNTDNLTAGTISATGQIFAGDNSNAIAISNIQQKTNVTFTGKGQQTDTLDGFYNSLIGAIGTQGNNIDSELQFSQQMMTQLNTLRDSTSGVSLDEEMTNLMQFQHAYSAAAKLISTTDEMMQTMIDMVPAT
jgi:flagellar hook-associated protein FlgK